MIRRSVSRSTRSLETTRDEALAWGKSVAQSDQEVLRRLLGSGAYPPARVLHPEAFAEAQANVNRSDIILGEASDLDLLYHLTVGLRARRVVETGVAYGWSSLAILLAQKAIGGGTLVSVDMPYPRLGSEGQVGCAVPDRLRASWRLIRRPDRTALPRALDDLCALDLAHYDSDKTYAGQSWAFPRMWAALRPGGALIADDIDMQAAFRDFVVSTGAVPHVVRCGDKLCGVIVKPGPSQRLTR
jgi:predicted O-methyltransferase YrrM